MTDFDALRRSARQNEMGRLVAILALCAAIANCSDSSQTGLGGEEDVLVRQIRAAVQMSGPLSARSTASASGPTPDSELVYVSTPSHTLNFGDSVVLTTASGAGAACPFTDSSIADADNIRRYVFAQLLEQRRRGAA